MFSYCALVTWLLTVSCAITKPSGTIKMYAYTRPVILGMKSTGDISTRSSFNNSDKMVNYYIYFEQTEPGMKVKRVWILGIPYKTTLQKVNLPLVSESGGPGKYKLVDTLVPITTNAVFRVIPSEKISGKLSRNKMELAANNAVVLEVLSGRKHLTGFSKNFIKLTPIVLQ
jgi:hypothetical protein